MNFELSNEQKMITRVAGEIAKEFPPEYWREKEERGEFAYEFWNRLVETGIVSMVFPEEYGGAGMGLLDLILVMEELCAGGCGLGGAWYLILTEVFGGIPIYRHGTNEQKEKYLPKIAKGMEFCMALTEPNAGSNTFKIETFAEKIGDEYVINGNKVFISGIDRARGMILIARTTPIDKVDKKTLGLTLFLVDLPNKSVKWSPISKHGINYSKTCEVSIKDLRVGEDSILGGINNIDRGWYILLDILNPERISFAIASIGTAKLAIKKAVEYSKQRIVFADPIGSYQSLQHPLAMAYSGLEAGKMLTLKAAWLFDNNASYREVGSCANMAKVVSIENAMHAIYWAMQVFGGYGYAKEFDVERWWREINLLRLAPVTQQLALNYIGEHVLGMPRSYR